MAVKWVSIFCSKYTREVIRMCNNRTHQHKEIMTEILAVQTFAGDFCNNFFDQDLRISSKY